MRIIFLLLIIYFPCLCYGQDSLQIDSTLKTFNSNEPVNVVKDSDSVENIDVPKKKKRKKLQKLKVDEGPIANSEKHPIKSNDNRFIIIGVIIIGVIIVFVYYRPRFARVFKQTTSNSKGEGFLSDYLKRILLSRRDYYRYVYLNSEAWNRKRYLVLKRDNWRCVYCGGRATQVHHTRYAKRNIGKEPIEWLVSICKTCHDAKH